MSPICGRIGYQEETKLEGMNIADVEYTGVPFWNFTEFVCIEQTKHVKYVEPRGIPQGQRCECSNIDQWWPLMNAPAPDRHDFLSFWLDNDNES